MCDVSLQIHAGGDWMPMAPGVPSACVKIVCRQNPYPSCGY